MRQLKICLLALFLATPIYAASRRIRGEGMSKEDTSVINQAFQDIDSQLLKKAERVSHTDSITENGVTASTITATSGTITNLSATTLTATNLTCTTCTATYVTINQTDAADSIKVQDGGNTVFEIYDGGIIDAPLNSLSRAFRSANITNGVGTSATKVSLSSETYDLQGEFDSTTNFRFVATKAGYYRATGQVECPTLGAANVKFLVYLYKNGVENTRSTCLSGGTADMSCAVSDTIQLAASDYIELYTNNSSGAAKDVTGGAGKTYLVVEKIR